ncbi:hypothetical protein LAZ67_1001570 [Cordylochernes scorpioides]|uniref:Reverse transcriptase Ty1/copia-type domain-containing protein n=1 Tax=Cordylochernes scorpioides TaxID=51811 RepID=A0ABY6JY67_9ARAC|nr:hypothetical protein LAZ67_1001570 [Cordylochernes scorpioides]
MKQPPGFEQRRKEQRVCRLNKAIYGLKQSGRIWFETLTNYLIKMNFKHLEIRQEENFVSMNQTRYIDTILEHFGMKDSNPSSVLLDPNQELDKFDSSEKCDQKRYQELLGSLMYLGTKTRPDIAFQLSTLSRYSKDPRQIHMGALKRILRYLKGTKHFSLEYKKDIPELRAYSDANRKERSTAEVKTTAGISYLLGNNLISWVSRSQEKVSLSTCDSEVNALTECVKKCIYIQYLCEELFNILGPRNFKAKIFCDNRSAIFLAQNGHVSNRSNHLVRKVAFLHECFIDGTFELHHVRSDENLADFLTKGIGRIKLTRILTTLGLR